MLRIVRLTTLFMIEYGLVHEQELTKSESEIILFGKVCDIVSCDI